MPEVQIAVQIVAFVALCLLGMWLGLAGGKS